MHRIGFLLLAPLVVFGAALTASAAWKSGGGPAVSENCLCEEAEHLGPKCITKNLECGTPCRDGAVACPLNSFCLDGAYNACPAVCLLGENPGTPCPLGTECIGGLCSLGNTCELKLPECLGGDACTASTDHVNGPAVTCGGVLVPTLSQWSLIALGLLLVATTVVLARRDGLPKQRIAGLLLWMSAGLIAVTVFYARIQQNRVCGEADVAVRFVSRLLDG